MQNVPTFLECGDLHLVLSTAQPFGIRVTDSLQSPSLGLDAFEIGQVIHVFEECGLDVTWEEATRQLAQDMNLADKQSVILVRDEVALGGRRFGEDSVNSSYDHDAPPCTTAPAEALAAAEKGSQILE